MGKRAANAIIALIIVALGVWVILAATGVAQLRLFNGWWSLFIIVPAVISMIKGGINGGNIMVFGIGIVLLLNANGLLGQVNLWLLLAGVVIVSIGLGMLLFRGNRNRRCAATVAGDQKEYTALFSGSAVDFEGEAFTGVRGVAIFGGLELDLRGARIEADATVEAEAIFGGMNIFVPHNVNVKVTSNAILGGVDSSVDKSQMEGRPTVYVDATAVFGGVDVRYEKK